MNTNILVAIKNIVQSPVTNLVSFYNSHNRINNVGEALEIYIKDVFANSVNVPSLEDKNRIYSEVFSYLGNQNNPPDIMIRGGDAIEVKKIESATSGLALNSSYPKDRVYCDSPMITSACKSCEEWSVKDLIYVVGNVKDSKLKSLWFVYGDCYAAQPDTYERIKNKITAGINELSDVELAETNEIGRVNRVDPLGITYLRIRGMWGIDNPRKVFNYISNIVNDGEFNINLIISENKYQSFPDSDKKYLEQLNDSNFNILNIKIKSPNNPAQLISAKLITFKK
jgi:hypothetical protein